MRRFRAAALAVAVVLAFCGAVWASDVDARFDELAARAQAHAAGRALADGLCAELDARLSREPFSRLWERAVRGASGAERLEAAWSLLRLWCPDGDVSRWDEVILFERPEWRPRTLMVIDALYVALLELRESEAGVWLAAGLLRDFSRSSHGRYDFLGVCPRAVADAVADIVSRTEMIGLWTPREVVGRLPLARPVRGWISDSRARDENMQFLDGHGLPANSGFYAWDRVSGRIYNVRVALPWD